MHATKILASALLAVAIAPTLVRASDDTGDGEPIYDFSNAYYQQNGIRANRLEGRRNGHDGISVVDRPLHSNQRNVRVTLAVGSYDGSGNLVFFSPLANVPDSAFLNNAAGREALADANAFSLYEFPRATNAPGVVFPKRQASLIDLSGGYFSNDPLGLWKFNFVRFTPAASDTSAGRAALAELVARNGADLDGTPIIKTLSELQDLEDDGFVAVTERPQDGSQGPRYFACPVYKDPRDGGIAPDAILEIVRDDAGNVLPGEQSILDEFLCLQQTGDFCN